MTHKAFLKLKETFPQVARSLIETHLDMSIAHNADFALNPDEARHHKPRWHQWGIISHTNRFLSAMETEVQTYIDQWDLRKTYNKVMHETIDGVSKEDLLQLGILYHDLGKFTSRHLSRHQSGDDKDYPDFSFGGHEAASEHMLHKHLADPLKEQGFTMRQIWYIGRLAALHYEIAKIRDHVKHSTDGYSLRFVEGDVFMREARLLHITYQDFALEVGLMYLGDTLAKTAFRLDPTPHSDTEIFVHPAIPEIKRMISASDLPAHHLDCVLHIPVAVAAVKRYMSFLEV